MSEQHLDAMFAALADPTRRAMLARLAKGEATVSELAQPFDLSQPAISKHIKVLERAGLITRTHVAQTRPCRLDARRMKVIAAWVNAYRHLWEDSFGRLDAYLASATPQQSKGRKNVGKSHRQK